MCLTTVSDQLVIFIYRIIEDATNDKSYFVVYKKNCEILKQNKEIWLSLVARYTNQQHLSKFVVTLIYAKLIFCPNHLVSGGGPLE